MTGVYQNAVRRGASHIYRMRYGVRGLLKEQIVDLGAKLPDYRSFELLKRTPGAFLSSCRHRLPDMEQDERPYRTGGNDSMNTIARQSAYGDQIGSPIRFIGVPKPSTTT